MTRIAADWGEIVFGRSDSPLTGGERAALEGVLAAVKPALSIAIGMAQGGTLRTIATHSDEVHAFARMAPGPDLLALRHVQFHTAEDPQRLTALLQQLAREGRNVDFVWVDEDQRPPGARQHVADLLASAAVADTVILLHDTMNQQVRSGIARAGVLGFPKVAAFDLDAVPGLRLTDGDSPRELRGGIGIIKVDATRAAYGTAPASQALSAYPVLAAIQEDLAGSDQSQDSERFLEWCRSRTELQTELRALRDERDRLVHRLGEAERVRSILTTSTSWKITRPLREAAAAVRGGR